MKYAITSSEAVSVYNENAELVERLSWGIFHNKYELLEIFEHTAVYKGRECRAVKGKGSIIAWFSDGKMEKVNYDDLDIRQFFLATVKEKFKEEVK